MKKQNELRKEFQEVVKSRNLMTPKVLDFIEIKNGVCELSEGRGIFTPKLYGVTVIVNRKKTDALSDCFTTIEEALNYIETLK